LQHVSTFNLTESPAEKLSRGIGISRNNLTQFPNGVCSSR
jgi:hypothetical protein